MSTTSARSNDLGLPPGTLIHVGEKRTEKVRITVIDYSESECQERAVSTVAECAGLKDTPTVTWINVDGVHDVDVIRDLGKQFDLHPLLLEDIANTTQRAKAEDYNDYLFTVLKMLYYDEEDDEVQAEQVSLVIGPRFVLSFQEREGDVFEPIRDRIRTARGRIRQTGADYLAYSLIDAIVDNYFLILEGVAERIEVMEEELVSQRAPELSHEVRRMKHQALLLRKSVWPLREVINTLGRGDSPLIQPATLPYLRDVYDHTIQVVDTIEVFRDAINSMLGTYLSVLSNRMNEVMKVLTIIATIFIPLTFVAGVYGMNFKVMPELNWRWGYPAALAVMAVVVIGMLVYFRKKKWL